MPQEVEKLESPIRKESEFTLSVASFEEEKLRIAKFMGMEKTQLTDLRGKLESVLEMLGSPVRVDPGILLPQLALNLDGIIEIRSGGVLLSSIPIETLPSQVFTKLLLSGVIPEFKRLQEQRQMDGKAKADEIASLHDSQTIRNDAIVVPPTIQRKRAERQTRIPGSQIIVSIYNEAMMLAERKFQIRFRAGSTIREIYEQLKRRVDNSDKGVLPFAAISSIMEDYLYATTFDESRVQFAKEMLRELNKIWSSAPS